jgi:hypothetical protein
MAVPTATDLGVASRCMALRQGPSASHTGNTLLVLARMLLPREDKRKDH